MNFRFVLTHIIEFARAQGYSIAVVGGFGLHAYGFSRVTYDLDFVTEVEIQASLVSFMESLGYETLYRSEGYSNHLHPQTEMGRVDFVYVRGESSRKIFARAKEKIIIDEVGAPVPRPEHLIAMKVQAMKIDPQRIQHELSDIRLLLSLEGVDRQEVRDYFVRAGMEGRFDELE
ncbi:MAG: hypothetical protein RL885_27725 [Planctomycetota bacterium]